MVKSYAEPTANDMFLWEVPQLSSTLISITSMQKKVADDMQLLREQHQVELQILEDKLKTLVKKPQQHVHESQSSFEAQKQTQSIQDKAKQSTSIAVANNKKVQVQLEKAAAKYRVSPQPSVPPLQPCKALSRFTK
ncbi:unnamed protein product [Sphenostylis stenocarpa]|uniref:Uncharacterized protein n=1 Tax=Sphenostylis stenocarpa TaxID=92480 RepID=A0AA86S2E1_9FABA|nr:unnamed protein product [Sphenostylis stenocarpa]